MAFLFYRYDETISPTDVQMDGSRPMDLLKIIDNATNFGISFDVVTPADRDFTLDFTAAPANHDVLRFNSASGNWEPVASSVGFVTSFNGRTGAVVPETNDYTWAQLDKTVSSIGDITTKNASDVDYDPTISGLAATDVKAALDEIAAKAEADPLSLHLDGSKQMTGDITWATDGAGDIGSADDGTTLLRPNKAWVKEDLSVGNKIVVGPQAGELTTKGTQSICLGWEAGLSLTTDYANVLIGLGSGRALTGTANNIFIGTNAGRNCTTVYSNIALGRTAGNRLNSSKNVAIGDYALGERHTSTGDLQNIAIGVRSLQKFAELGANNIAIGVDTLITTEGARNIALGANAGRYGTGDNKFYLNSYDRTNAAGDQTKSLLYGGFAVAEADQFLTVNAGTLTTIGDFFFGAAGARARAVTSNIFIGRDAGLSHTTGIFNTAVGQDAGRSLTSGQGNTAFGSGALQNSNPATNQGYNTAIGNNALNAATVAEQNTSVGMNSMRENITGVGNVAMGFTCLRNITSGHFNTAIGLGAGRYFGSGTSSLVTSNNSIFVGFQSRAAADNSSNEIVIGAEALGNGNNTATIGNAGTITDTYLAGRVHATGSVQVADDSVAASAAKVGALRYRADANNSYVDMVMQTGAATYAWVNIVQNSW